MTITEHVERLRQMPVGALLVEYRQLYGKEPRCKNQVFLWKRCAWKIQEREFGGLSDIAKRRLEELIAEIKLPIEDQQRTIAGKLTVTPAREAACAGTTFTRTWRGRELRATAVAGGFECEGAIYKSLSAVAKAVTGAHWNGRLFFGLTERKSRDAMATEA